MNDIRRQSESALLESKNYITYTAALRVNKQQRLRTKCGWKPGSTAMVNVGNEEEAPHPDQSCLTLRKSPSSSGKCLLPVWC